MSTKSAMQRLFMTAILGVWATGAVAHSPLEMTMPADNAKLADAPLEILLDFKGNIRLTKVKTTHADHPSVDLDLTGFSGFISDYRIPIQPIGSGPYVIEWRGLGTDGHAMDGSFNFSVE